MRNIFFLLPFLFFLNPVAAQSISLQLGSRITPNAAYWLYDSPHKQLLWGVSSFYYQPKIGKKIELVTGLQLSYTQFQYQYALFDCTVGMTKIPTNIIIYNRPLLTELQLGTNILLFSTPNQKWTFLLTPSVRMSGFSWIKTNTEKQYEDGTSAIFTDRLRSTASASETYAALGGQIGEETRFHFTHHFFACAKIWGGYEYTRLKGQNRGGIGLGSQFGIGYKWK